MVFKWADPDEVALYWAQTVCGVPAGKKVPEDQRLWAENGFVVAQPVGGRSNLYYPLHAPVITYQAWACNIDSDMPPWWKAKNLIETMRQETYNHLGRLLVLPYRDQNARVLQSYFVSESRPVYGDLGDYAAQTVNVCLHWTPVPKS